MAAARFKVVAERLLAVAGVATDGPHPWGLQVHDDRLRARVFAEGTVGFCEAYAEGWWDAERLDETMARILGFGVHQRLPRNLKTAWLALQARWTNRQSQRRTWTVGREHYDLGNELFEATFDARQPAAAGTGGTRETSTRRRRRSWTWSAAASYRLEGALHQTLRSANRGVGALRPFRPSPRSPSTSILPRKDSGQALCTHHPVRASRV